MTCISVIIPTHNEAERVDETLAGLQPLRTRGHEVVLVDGGSDDGTPERAAPYVDRMVEGPRGRARQMNAGAAVARGEVFWFLHADTLTSSDPDEAILTGLATFARHWGRFDVRLSGGHYAFRMIEAMMNLRSRLTGIATGDQGIFVERACFEAVGGFPAIPLMEDIALSRALAVCGRPVNLGQQLVTSSRRWEEGGIARTILLMWRLRLSYALGADPARLAKKYYGRAIGPPQ
jgi:rSAM/selenodomain-associated transferase 2